MRKLHFKASFVQILYIVTYAVLFCLIVLIPRLIRGDIHLSEKLIFEEEIFEGSLLGLLFILNVVIMNLYKKEVSRQKSLILKINEEKKSAQERLHDSFKYIGQVNVQLQQIKSIFNNHDKFPETKNDFKKTLNYFSDRVFGIVDAKWVLFRIINSNTHKTVHEHFEVRLGFTADYPHISNKTIAENQSCSSFSAVISNPQNLNILVCCVLPYGKISNDELVLIQAITNEITMLFVILNSTYYKHSGDLLSENISGKSIKLPYAAVDSKA